MDNQRELPVEQERQVLVKPEEKPLVPGIGLAGTVMCPFMGLQPMPCLKGGCELWVELTTDGVKVARCSMAWLAVLATETNGVLQKLAGGVPAPVKKAQPEETK